MIQKLAELDRKQRLFAGIGIFVLSTMLCYFLIARGFVNDFHRASSNKDARELERQGLALVNAELAVTEKTLAQVQEQAAVMKAMCCSEEQADRFFGQVTTWATQSGLTPFSRVVSKPVALPFDPNGIPLQTQSAEISVQGSIFNLIKFFNMLVDRPQRVSITDLRIRLVAGESYEPRAAFRLSLVIDPTSEGKTS